MNFFKKTISAHFFTTINFSMFLRALYFCILPFNWLSFRKWASISNFENAFLKFIKWNQEADIISFYNCRSAIYHSIELIWANNWDEVIIQAFTCVSVPNSLIQAWVKPIYVDIDKTMNIDTDKIEEKISDKTKAILVQHTFWNPADIKRIKEICSKYNIYLIEDCAHCLWAEIDWVKLGNFWDISVFSTWRDKVVSSVNWWILIINNSKLAKNKWIILSALRDAPFGLVLKNMNYIIISYLSFIFYDIFWIWKVIIYLSRKLSLVPEVLSKDEKKCKDNVLFYKMPNCLCFIWLSEFSKINKYNAHRIKIAQIYNDDFISNKLILLPNTLPGVKNIYLRYTVFVNDPRRIIKYFKRNKILLWDWYSYIIDPIWVKLEDCKYKVWECEKVEKCSAKCINLPNHYWVSVSDAKNIVQLLNNYLKD